MHGWAEGRGAYVELEGRRIVVTGGAGFIGSHLADALARANDLVVIDDFSVGRRENLAQLEGLANVRIVAADISDRDAMHELCAGAELVFHLAISCLRTSLGRPFMSHDVNAGGTLTLCLAAQQRRVKRFLYVSSSEVYGSALVVPMSEEHPLQPTTVYGASKLAGELYAQAVGRTYGLPVSVVRPFNTYGPREPWQGARAEVIPRFLLALEAAQAPVIYGDGLQTRDFTYVEDTVRGLLLAAACDELVGGVVNLARGRAVSIRRVAELLRELIGGDAPAPRFASDRPGDVSRHCADVAKAKRLFGFEPEVDFDDGLARTLAWFRAQKIAVRADSGSATRPNW